MRILLTNDDGIYAEGIYAAYKALSKIAEVTVVAPDYEQSSVGHGITLFYPLFAKRISPENHFDGYAVSGKPADCVKFAVSVLFKGKKPDLVVSGINLGGNDGCSVFYSGTVAAAREGALMGLKAFSISLDCFDDPDFAQAAKFTSRFALWVHKNHLPSGTFLNVNVPLGKPKGVLFTRQGTEPIHEIFEKRKSPHDKHYYWMGAKMPVHKNDNKIDTYALKNKYITITPVRSDLTDEGFLSNVLMEKI
ncbi:MAG: 5'/3'-nucleotidase SurE [Candidatus Omnitrophica bacterium]|nr:5'/3'-nucleotidase SurE [Candidatus Omnitrophota bacterium]MDE2009736.1 5'/3'-nucleotidase SurE [Candidatus Omnitrophota bacterium]MDE2213867.1 5'/3'-nucleotidase SurE [Candidatus Omnitrophota bacterium]MDE2231874.1 5'/3'-nucleotidase SurE [Candidatus Omnitrophota bacterium]